MHPEPLCLRARLGWALVKVSLRLAAVPRPPAQHPRRSRHRRPADTRAQPVHQRRHVLPLSDPVELKPLKNGRVIPLSGRRPDRDALLPESALQQPAPVRRVRHLPRFPQLLDVQERSEISSGVQSLQSGGHALDEGTLAVAQYVEAIFVHP